MSKTKFDQVILDNIIKKEGAEKFGYVVNDGRVYSLYYTEEEFEKFKSETDLPEYKGAELEKRVNKAGKETPPKMASVASSSRFCYLALKNGAKAIGGTGGVQFEKECKIKGVGGTAPQLDAHVAGGNIYVEAKCHEIFDEKKTTMREAYVEYIISERDGIGFAVPAELTIQKEEFKIPYNEFGFSEAFHRLDFKQFLCHLLGIACQGKPATLVYLFFKPKNEAKQKEIDIIFDKLQDEIKTVFDNEYIKQFCGTNNITLKAYAEYSEVMDDLTEQNRVTLY